MSGRLSRRIGTLEAWAGRQRAIDEADAPPDFKMWGDPVARGLIAHAALKAALMAWDDTGSGHLPISRDQAREIGWLAAKELDDLIARDGLEVAKARFEAECKQEKEEDLAPWERDGWVPYGQRTPENWPPKDWDPTWRLG